MSTEQAIELQEQAWVLQANGRLDEAADVCGEALRLVELHEGPKSPDTANLLNDLAEIESSRQHFALALSLAVRAFEIEDQLGEEFSGTDATHIRIKTRTLLGELRRMLGDPSGGHDALVSAVSIAVSEFGVASIEAGEAHNNLAVAYKYAGRFDEALALYQSALTAILARDGEDSLDTAILYHNIGGIFHASGDFTAAEEPGRRAWEISRRFLGEDNLQTIIDAEAYAAILDGLERFEESELIHRHALDFLRRECVPEHHEIAAVLHNLAATVASQGRLEEAERYYRQALSIRDKLFGEDSADAALTRNNIGAILNTSGRYMEAENLLSKALTCLARQLPAGHPHLVTVENHLCCARLGLSDIG